ncbi:DMT family transporter [Devosia ginsengisoli]|uniref:DMT family transporter n=1 Tax=Devosia ginsengisoli TaxID=400770 RepID=A0A5B8LQD1_9HYPH|nr:DMT family transporter [Devosia ginsengisoli]
MPPNSASHAHWTTLMPPGTHRSPAPPLIPSLPLSAPAPVRVETASLTGMALGVAAYSLFAAHDAMIKGVITALPAPQILFVRGVVVIALCLIIGRHRVVIDLWHSKNRMLILGRGLMTLAAWVMYYSAGRDLQLAEMTTLYYVAPVLTTVLAVIFLKEQLTLARIGGASIGFFGIVVAANPSGFTIGWPVIMVLGAALFWAFAMILMRTISRSDSTLVQVFAQNLIHVLVMAVAALPFWQGMGLREIALCVAAGLVGGLAQFILVEAARSVPASVLGTVEYGALIWSFIFGYLFWAEMPVTTVYVGAFLVVAAGLTLALSEHRNRREIIDAP